MKIRNKSDSLQTLTGISEFQPQEEREVDDIVGEYLLKNPYFEEVKKSKKEKESESK